MKINRSLMVLGVTSVAVLVLGTLGFHRYEPNHGWLTAFYQALQLFSLESGVVDNPPTPLLLEIARWLALGALLGVVYATVTALLRHFRSALRIASMKGHTVICGAGKRGCEIAFAFCRQPARGVVVIEIDESSPAAGELRNLGVELIFGNALDSTVLKKAGVARAAALVAVTGSDEKNLAICSEVENRLNMQCILSAGVESLAWRSYFLDRLQPESKIRLDSYQNRAARNLMMEIACEAGKDRGIQRRGIRLLIEADGQFREELLRAAAVVLQISGDTRPVVDLTNTTEAEEAAFEERFPGAPLVIELNWYRHGACRVFREVKEAHHDFAVFARCHDAATLEAADRFLVRHENGPTCVYACLGSDTQMFETGSIRRQDQDFNIRNLFALGLGKIDPLETDIEKAAIKCHGIYWANERAKDPNYDKLPLDWNLLSERYRESNRLAAMYHEVKRQVWATREDGEDADMLDRLSRCEHMRWMAEKVMDGWRWSGSHDPQSRNNKKLLHHLMVPYDALSRPEKDKDCNAFLWALGPATSDLRSKRATNQTIFDPRPKSSRKGRMFSSCSWLSSGIVALDGRGG